MTEIEWLTSKDPLALLRYIGEKAPGIASAAILETFCVAVTGGPPWVSAGWQPHFARKAIVGKDPVRCCDIMRDIVGNPFRMLADCDYCPRCKGVNGFIGQDYGTYCADCKDSPPMVAALVPYSVLAWEDFAIPKLALSIGEGKGFGVALMPALADMLQKAGSACPQILSHCRGINLCPNCHAYRPRWKPSDGFWCSKPMFTHIKAPCVRGCWAVDAILGSMPKERDSK